jgi:hypothetical protein
MLPVSFYTSFTQRGSAVTPLGVKHALASKALVIIISYMIIIACNIDPFKFKVEKQLLKTQILYLSAKEW